MKSANPRQIYQFVPSNMIHHKKLKTWLQNIELKSKEKFPRM
jgi:hypothetical protein